MNVELLTSHGFQRARGDLGQKRQKMRIAKGRKPIPRRMSPAFWKTCVVDSLVAMALQDQSRNKVGLIKCVDSHIGRQVTRRGDERPVARLFLRSAHVGAHLNIKPGVPIAHVVESFRLCRNPLVDTLGTETDKTRGRGICITLKKELRQIRPLLSALRGPAKHHLLRQAVASFESCSTAVLFLAGHLVRRTCDVGKSGLRGRVDVEPRQRLQTVQNLCGTGAGGAHS